MLMCDVSYIHIYVGPVCSLVMLHAHVCMCETSVVPHGCIFETHVLQVVVGHMYICLYLCMTHCIHM